MRRHILPLVLCFALGVQMVLPSLMSLAAKSGFNPALYMCNITETVPPEAAQALLQAQLADIFEAAGKPLPDETKHGISLEHCSHCLAPAIAQMPPVFTAQNKRCLLLTKMVFTALSLAFHYKSQGPPLGGRAPPVFV